MIHRLLLPIVLLVLCAGCARLETPGTPFHVSSLDTRSFAVAAEVHGSWVQDEEIFLIDADRVEIVRTQFGPRDPREISHLTFCLYEQGKLLKESLSACSDAVPVNQTLYPGTPLVVENVATRIDTSAWSREKLNNAYLLVCIFETEGCMCYATADNLLLSGEPVAPVKKEN